VGRLLLICLGGALGSGARYLVSGFVAERVGAAFPYGILLVNASGSFLIAAVMILSLEAGVVSPRLRLFLTTGVMGGYTTYSSFNYEVLALAGRGAFGTAVVYFTLTVVGCLTAGYFGAAAARAASRPRRAGEA